MVQIVTPEKKPQSNFAQPLIIVNFLLSIVLLLSVIGAFSLLFDIKSQITELKSFDVKQSIEATEGKIEQFQKTQKEILAQSIQLGDEFREFKAKIEKEVERLKKENEVLLLNNRDFIKAFEAIERDLQAMKEKGVVIAYKEEMGEVTTQEI